jgi:hypothetical protein
VYQWHAEGSEDKRTLVTAVPQGPSCCSSSPRTVSLYHSHSLRTHFPKPHVPTHSVPSHGVCSFKHVTFKETPVRQPTDSRHTAVGKWAFSHVTNSCPAFYGLLPCSLYYVYLTINFIITFPYAFRSFIRSLPFGDSEQKFVRNSYSRRACYMLCAARPFLLYYSGGAESQCVFINTRNKQRSHLDRVPSPQSAGTASRFGPDVPLTLPCSQTPKQRVCSEVLTHPPPRIKMAV